MTLSNIAFVMISVGFWGLLFLIACLLEQLSIWWHDRRYQMKRDRYRGHMRDLTSPPRLDKMASYRECDKPDI